MSVQNRTKIKWIFDIDRDLDERFRKVIARKLGLHKGVLKTALTEAIENWIKNN